jgi:hypothetical protein
VLDQLESELGRSLLSVAPPDWRRLDLQATLVHLFVDLRAIAVLPDDSTVPLELPPGFLMILDDLRRAQWEPNTGTWLAFRLLVDPPDAYVALYNFELTPDWAPAVTAEEYAEDLNPYPRRPEHIPGWWDGREPDFGDRERILVRIADCLKFALPSGADQVRISATPDSPPTAQVRTVNDTEQPWDPPPFLGELLGHHRAAGNPWHSATLEFAHRGDLRADFAGAQASVT